MRSKLFLVSGSAWQHLFSVLFSLHSFRWIVVAGLFFASIPGVLAQTADTTSAGINFYEGTLSEVFETAGQQEKLIFLDVYTAWCGPCHVMSRTVFKDSLVGDTMNSDFVSYKIDAEKGEGLEVKLQYNVNTFPTYLFFNPDGELIHYAGAGMNRDLFLNVIEQGRNGDKSRYQQYNMAAKAQRIIVAGDSSRRTYRLAVEPIEQSLGVEEYFYNCYLAALAYHKLGEEEKAREYAQKALDFLKPIIRRIRHNPYTDKVVPDTILIKEKEMQNIVGE